MRKEERSATNVKQFYDDFHSKICLKESARFNRWLLKILEPASGAKLLDIACGGGYLLSEAAKKGIESYGVEISEKAISIARAQTGKKVLIAADAEHLPWPDDFFDLITCLGSLEHFLHPQRALQEMIRTAKPDARFCILVPNLFSWDNIEQVKKTGQPPSHGQELERFATRTEWEQLLRENGFSVIKVQNYNGFPRLLEAKNGKIKVKSLRKFFRRFFVPFNLCSSFIFICRKA
ncbi:class I SAM-dependent methyltransferase [Candidatus Omnitrophota bacterium]